MSKIFDLPVAAPLSGDETVVMVQDGATKQGSIGDHIDALINPGLAIAAGLLDQTEAARDVATAAGPHYTSVAAGEAATTTGETFWVAAGGDLDLYRRTAGVSVLLFRARKAIYITDLISGTPDGRDNTPAMVEIEAYLAARGGGSIILPTGEYRMNWQCFTDNITVVGGGGRAEYDDVAIRPYNMGLPVMRISDGTRYVRDTKLINVHLSGTDGTAGADVQSAKSASHALKLMGGAVNFVAFGSILYNGIRTIGLEPSATHPVTTGEFLACRIRNDLTDSALARAIYGKRLADPGYLTAMKFAAGTKLNGPTLGYAAEFDGAAAGITVEINDSYWDVKPDHGILLKGPSGIVCHNFQLDPGTNGAVIIETDQAISDVSRYISGMMRHGGQKMKFAGGATVDIPAEADIFSYKGRHAAPFLGREGYFTLPSAPYDVAVGYDFQSTVGPMRWNGVPHRFTDTTQAASLVSAGLVTDGGFATAKNARIGGDFYIYGGNAAASGYISANSGSGGLYVAALGTNQSVKITASGTGSVQIGASGITSALIPYADNTQTLGSGPNRWGTVYAGTPIINTSDARDKSEIGPIEDAVLRAWAKVDYVQFKYADAVELKGDGARWHFGVVAQRVEQAFADEGLDPFALGVLCFDAWPEQPAIPEILDEDGNVIQPAQEARQAGDRYGIRYEEAFILECALMRRRLDVLEGST